MVTRSTQPSDQSRDMAQEILDLGSEIRAAQAKLLLVENRQKFANDESAPLFGALSALCGIIDRASRLLVERLAGPAQPAQAVFTDGQVDDIGRRLLSSCQMWSRNLMRASLVKSWAAMAATVLAAALVGGFLSWLAFGRPLDTQCRDERGGRWCGYWLTQPTAK